MSSNKEEINLKSEVTSTKDDHDKFKYDLKEHLNDERKNKNNNETKNNTYNGLEDIKPVISRQTKDITGLYDVISVKKNELQQTKKKDEIKSTDSKLETRKKDFLSLSVNDRDRLSKGKIKNFDANLKFLTKILYERKGYYCEVECRLYEDSYFGKYKKEEISDVDVLGIKYESDLKRFRVGIECKSTSNNGLDELLKVRGLQELLELDYVGLVKNSLSNNVRLVATKLGVQLHSEKELVSILEGIIPNITESLEKESNIYIISENIENELKSEIKGIINFINSDFWTNAEYQNINTIVRVLDTFKGKTFRSYQIKYITLRLATLLSISLLDVASLIIKSNYSNLEHVSIDMLFGGATQRREKERAYDIISQELGKRIDPNPPYKNDYLNLISWVVKDPYHSRYLPQCLDFYLQCYLRGDSYSLIAQTFSPITVKLSKDILKFISNVMGTDKVHQDFLEI